MRNKWIDFMEDELSPNAKLDAELLLKHSPMDREILHGYQRLRRLIKNSDVEGVPQNPEYFASLHNSIITALEVSVSESDKGKKERSSEQVSTLSE